MRSSQVCTLEGQHHPNTSAGQTAQEKKTTDQHPCKCRCKTPQQNTTKNQAQ